MQATEPQAGPLADRIRRHYTPPGLAPGLLRALQGFGPGDRPLDPASLAPLDQFHTRGAAATADLARLAGIAASDRVIDVGAGLGGPARLIAAETGCTVLGIDLSPAFVEAARHLTERTGQTTQVRFDLGDALALPVPDAAFTVALLLHVAMNVADRASLYREIRRVLVPGGRFATYDLVRGSGTPGFPLPWANTPETSFLLTPAETREAVEAAGFRTRLWHDDTDAALAFFAARGGAGAGPAAPTLLGEDFPRRVANLAAAIADRRLRVLAAVFDAA
jgi:sarcosine/dimethylglycine N-methyltransferase